MASPTMMQSFMAVREASPGWVIGSGTSHASPRSNLTERTASVSVGRG